MTIKQKKADQDGRRAARNSIRSPSGSSIKSKKAAQDARRKLRG